MHPHVQHEEDFYEMSTISSPAVPKPSSNCRECTNLVKQLAECLDKLEKVQVENDNLKENLKCMSDRTKMLFTIEDCDLYESELLHSFQKVKERKVMMDRDFWCCRLVCDVHCY